MEFDVIVVGAGAVGGSIAYELSTRGLSVCRIGETDRTNAASKAAGAMNGCFGEVTSGLLSSEYGRLKLNMDRQAKLLWASWAEGLAISSGDFSSLFTSIGTHVLLNTAGMDEVDSVNYDTIESTLRDYGEPFEVVDPRKMEWLKPNHLVRPLQGLYIPNEHSVNSHLLLEKLDAAFVREGGTLKNENAKRVLAEGRVATGVELCALEVMPPPMRTMMALLSRVLMNTPEVYWDIQLENDQASHQRAALAEGMERLIRNVRNQDYDEFRLDLQGVSNTLGSRLNSGAVDCQHVFSLLN